MEEGLDLIGLWRIIMKRWYLVVLLPLIMAGAFYAYSYHTYTPVYTASATLMIARPESASQSAYYDIYYSRAMVGTYREIVLSRRILNVVADDEMMPYDADQLRGRLRVEGIEGTELIGIAATDTDPVLASYIANMVSRIFMDQIGMVISDAYVTILDEAPVPGGPSNPRAGRSIIVAFMFGLFAAGGLAFLLNSLDQFIREPAEAEKLLGLPVMGVLPKVEGQKEFTVSGRSTQAEVFRTIRTNIQFTSVDRPIKRILVTGANPNCGKSTVAANLAVTFAQAEGKVLLVDADLRRPTQQRFFNINGRFGLSDLVFKGNLDLAAVLQESGKDGLKIIPSGLIPPNPAEMLSSQRMKELVKDFSERFDYIIFDSPPVLAVTDAAILSRLVDGTIFVLDYGRVKRDDAVEGLKQLQKVQANVIGTVINGVPLSKDLYNGYRYYYGVDNSTRQKNRKSKPR
jgi:polysaccharide biosynthesis transport protein